jgi:hypothetical protein
LVKWINDHQEIFYQTITFFWDKYLIFLNNDYGAHFVRIPYKTREIYHKELLTTNDDGVIEFNITFRYMNDVIAGQKVPVYTGYIKKSKSLKRDNKVGILFNFPHEFINPFFINDKKNDGMITRLETELGLERKDDDRFGDFTNDFGEKDFFTGSGGYHKNKFFELGYRPDFCVHVR